MIRKVADMKKLYLLFDNDEDYVMFVLRWS